MAKENETTPSKPTEMALEQAVKIVNEAIRKEEQRLREIANETTEQEPVLIEGTTTTNYFCRLMAEPRPIARTLLDYNFPTCKILGTDAPDDMWEYLGRIYGLQSVCSVDI